MEGDQLVLQKIMSTLMACADNLATEQEQIYLKALSAVTRYELANDQLTLADESGSNFLNFVRL